MSILMVLTSHDRLGDTGKPTGLWLEEFATPYYIFRDEGVKVVLASPKGGRPPIDPRSEDPQAQTDSTRRFFKDKEALEAFENTARAFNDKSKRLRRCFLSRWTRPPLGPLRGSALDQDHRNPFCGWQARGCGLPWSGCVPPHQRTGRRTSHPREIRDGLFEFRRSRRRANRGRSFPCRGYAEGERRQLLQG